MIKRVLLTIKKILSLFIELIFSLFSKTVDKDKEVVVEEEYQQYKKTQSSKGIDNLSNISGKKKLVPINSPDLQKISILINRLKKIEFQLIHVESLEEIDELQSEFIEIKEELKYFEIKYTNIDLEVKEQINIGNQLVKTVNKTFKQTKEKISIEKNNSNILEEKLSTGFVEKENLDKDIVTKEEVVTFESQVPIKKDIIKTDEEKHLIEDSFIEEKEIIKDIVIKEIDDKVFKNEINLETSKPLNNDSSPKLKKINKKEDKTPPKKLNNERKTSINLTTLNRNISLLKRNIKKEKIIKSIRNVLKLSISVVTMTFTSKASLDLLALNIKMNNNIRKTRKIINKRVRPLNYSQVLKKHQQNNNLNRVIDFVNLDSIKQIQKLRQEIYNNYKIDEELAQILVELDEIEANLLRNLKEEENLKSR